MNEVIIQKFLNKISDTNLIGTAKAVRYLSYLLIKKPASKVFSKNIYGFSLWLDPVNDTKGIEHRLYYLGTYEKGTIHVIDAYLKENDHFLDIGANIGFITLFAAKKNSNGQVFAFEANPDTVQILNTNVKDNGVKNVNVFDFALGSENGNALLFPDTIKNNRGGASLFKTHQNENFIEILVKKFDDLPESKLTFAMMKLDVEGFEMEVLKGATNFLKQDNAPAIIVECVMERENQNYSGKDLFRFLKSINSYRIFKLEKGALRISKLIEVIDEIDIPDADNLFCFLPNQIQRIQHIIK